MKDAGGINARTVKITDGRKARQSFAFGAIDAA
jgi:hypothetical protein